MTCGLTFTERRAQLAAEHGRARSVDRAAALRLLGLRETVHPNNVVAFTYRDRAAAQAYHASNADHQGVPSLGITTCDGGVIGVLDLRPVLTEYGNAPTDPALPDRIGRRTPTG